MLQWAYRGCCMVWSWWDMWQNSTATTSNTIRWTVQWASWQGTRIYYVDFLKIEKLLPCVHMHNRVMRLVMSVCVTMYACIHICVCVYVAKKLPVWWDLTTWKSPVSVIYCSLIEINHQKMRLLCQAIRFGKEIQKHFINRTGQSQGFWNIALWYKPRLV